MNAVIAKDCYDCKQHVATGKSYDGGVTYRTARQVLAANLKSLMAKTPAYGTQTKLGKKAGLGQTTISLMLRPLSDSMKSPKLDSVEAVATVFGLQAWQMLLDEERLGPQMHDLLTKVIAENKRVAEKYGVPEGSERKDKEDARKKGAQETAETGRKAHRR